MVKVGFIVEGDSEKIFIESKEFNHWSNSKGVEVLRPVINAGGGGNLLPENIREYVAVIRCLQPDKIAVLTDLEAATSPAEVKSRIQPEKYGIDLVFIAVKALEAWFLADTVLMRKWLNDPNFYEDFPEVTIGMPWDRLKEISAERKVRGPGISKPCFAKKITSMGFSVARAAEHPHCPQARLFCQTLSEVSTSMRLL